MPRLWGFFRRLFRFGQLALSAWFSALGLSVLSGGSRCLLLNSYDRWKERIRDYFRESWGLVFGTLQTYRLPAGTLRSHVPRGGLVYSGRTGSVVAVRELLSAVAVEQENLIRLREGVKCLIYLHTHASIYVFGLTLRVTDQNRAVCAFWESPCEVIAASSKSGRVGIVNY